MVAVKMGMPPAGGMPGMVPPMPQQMGGPMIPPPMAVPPMPQAPGTAPQGVMGAPMQPMQPQQMQQRSNAPRRRGFGDYLENVLVNGRTYSQPVAADNMRDLDPFTGQVMGGTAMTPMRQPIRMASGGPVPTVIPTGATLASGTVLNSSSDPVVFDSSGYGQNQSQIASSNNDDYQNNVNYSTPSYNQQASYSSPTPAPQPVQVADVPVDSGSYLSNRYLSGDGGNSFTGNDTQVADLRSAVNATRQGLKDVGSGIGSAWSSAIDTFMGSDQGINRPKSNDSFGKGSFAEQINYGGNYDGDEEGIFDSLGDYISGALGFAEGGAVPRRTEIAGQDHMLAYINRDEERLLRGLGGSGIAGPGGIPSYPPDSAVREDNAAIKSGSAYNQASSYGTTSAPSNTSVDFTLPPSDNYESPPVIATVNYNDTGSPSTVTYYDDSGSVSSVVQAPAPAPAPTPVPQPSFEDQYISDISRQVAEEKLQADAEQKIKALAEERGISLGQEDLDYYTNLRRSQVPEPAWMSGVGQADITGISSDLLGDTSSDEFNIFDLNFGSLTQPGQVGRPSGLGTIGASGVSPALDIGAPDALPLESLSYGPSSRPNNAPSVGAGRDLDVAFDPAGDRERVPSSISSGRFSNQYPEGLGGGYAISDNEFGPTGAVKYPTGSGGSVTIMRSSDSPLPYDETKGMFILEGQPIGLSDSEAYNVAALNQLGYGYENLVPTFTIGTPATDKMIEDAQLTDIFAGDPIVQGDVEKLQRAGYLFRPDSEPVPLPSEVDEPKAVDNQTTTGDQGGMTSEEVLAAEEAAAPPVDKAAVEAALKEAQQNQGLGGLFGFGGQLLSGIVSDITMGLDAGLGDSLTEEGRAKLRANLEAAKDKDGNPKYTEAEIESYISRTQDTAAEQRQAMMYAQNDNKDPACPPGYVFDYNQNMCVPIGGTGGGIGGGTGEDGTTEEDTGPSYDLNRDRDSAYADLNEIMKKIVVPIGSPVAPMANGGAVGLNRAMDDFLASMGG